MGLAEPLAEFQRFDGLRSIGHGVTLELAWPEHPDFPSYGYVVRRRDLDEMVAARAVKAGATLWPAAEALAPVVEDGVVGRRDGAAATTPARSRRCGPGTWSSPTAPTPGSAGPSAPPATAPIPSGMAIRGYFTSPLHDEPWIESHLDIRDKDGQPLARATGGSSRSATAR